MTLDVVCLQALEQSGHPAEDLRVLHALWNIFSAFSQPLEELALVDEEQADGAAASSTGGSEGTSFFRRSQSISSSHDPQSDV
jgi:hypothetical protein